LGDWGPVEVKKENAKDGVGARKGAPVFTIETMDNNESWAFFDDLQIMSANGKEQLYTLPLLARVAGKRRFVWDPDKYDDDRSKELQAYADGIIKVILEGG
jgi:hypothetical protein